MACALPGGAEDVIARVSRNGADVNRSTEDRRDRPLAVFLRLWLVFVSSYALFKLAVDLAFGGFVDLRLVALWGLVWIPLGQAAVVYVIRRRAAGGFDGSEAQRSGEAAPARQNQCSASHQAQSDGDQDDAAESRRRGSTVG